MARNVSAVHMTSKSLLAEDSHGRHDQARIKVHTDGRGIRKGMQLRADARRVSADELDEFAGWTMSDGDDRSGSVHYHLL